MCVFHSSANKCLLKVGGYCAQLEQYQKAIEIYEQVMLPLFFIFYKTQFFLFLPFFPIKNRLQVGANTMDNPLLKYSAKEYFFKASLCHFIVDELNAKVRFSLCYSLQGLGKRGGSSFFFNTLPTLHRSRLKNMRRCSRLSRTQENANC